MKLSRFTAIFNGMNGSAKKVYEAVPKTTHWSQFKIMKELERLGKQMDPAAVKGCLGYMLSMGIIEENKEHEFKRTAIRMTKATNDEPDPIPATVPTKEETEMATSPQIPIVTNPASPFDVLAILANKARSLADRASDLEEEANAFAKEVEDTALRLAEDAEKHTAELADLRQLKELLGRFK